MKLVDLVFVRHNLNMQHRVSRIGYQEKVLGTEVTAKLVMWGTRFAQLLFFCNTVPNAHSNDAGRVDAGILEVVTGDLRHRVICVFIFIYKYMPNNRPDYF